MVLFLMKKYPAVWAVCVCNAQKTVLVQSRLCIFAGKEKTFPALSQYVYPTNVRYSKGLQQGVVFYTGGEHLKRFSGARVESHTAFVVVVVHCPPPPFSPTITRWSHRWLLPGR